ncbi:MAG TPA: MBL fold metallo-hydrolase [Candidatus Dormibacteraeota bacterium]|nr:MBL fold metallo-hydrolase [Candidatus Dormibacteraeota bacterium]
MELTILGASGGWPDAGRACSGYLLTEGPTRVWIDAGSGTLAELLRHARLEEVDALWVSHLHPDHCSDVGPLRNALAYGDARRGRPLIVYGPPGWPDWIEAAVPDAEDTRAAFDMREIEEGVTARIGAIAVTARAVHHGVPTFGGRFEGDATVLAYSADSRPCPALPDLARDADLLLCEAFRSSPEVDAAHTVMTPEEAGTVAAEAGARSLLLTHLHPCADRAAARARAATSFGGPIEVAEQGRTYPVSAAR